MLLSLYLWVCVICMLAIWSSLQPEKEVPRHNIPSDDSSYGGGAWGQNQNCASNVQKLSLKSHFGV
jgi:hypothetical protein